MKLVLTNDDGIDAPGLSTLVRVAGDVGEATIVAPEDAQSGVGHRLTTRSPIRVVAAGESRYRVDGTPADCARIALSRLVPDAEWLLSGINRGGNLGADVFTSGTVAAAREAALLGCRAIAISQYVGPEGTVNWEVTASWSRAIISQLLHVPLAAGSFWNVNLPSTDDGATSPGVVYCPMDPSPLDVQYRDEGGSLVYAGSYHARPRIPGHDVALCLGGNISVTAIPIDPGR